MIYVCQSCKGETHSRADRMKVSTCADCTADNPTIVGWKFTCACADVGHDQSKIPQIKPMSKSLVSDIKEMIGDEEEINKERSSDAKV